MNLPSGKYPRFFCFVGCSRRSSGVLNGWFSATMCMENPNTKMANTTRNRPKSFIRSPMMIAHGPNRWWNDKKSKIWTHASKNDKAKHWLRQYSSVGQYSTVNAHATWEINWKTKSKNETQFGFTLGQNATYCNGHQHRPFRTEVRVVWWIPAQIYRLDWSIRTAAIHWASPAGQLHTNMEISGLGRLGTAARYPTTSTTASNRCATWDMTWT